MIRRRFSLIGMSISVLSLLALVSCNGGSKGSEQTVIDGEYGKHEINITIWAADALCQTFANQAKAYCETTELDIGFRVQAVAEDTSATNMITDVNAGADIYCFAQDQLARLVQVGAIAPVADAYIDSVSKRNDDVSVACSKLNDTIYAFPLTSDNGYFMYYDKSVFPDEDDGTVSTNLEHMDDIIKTLKEAGNKKIYYELGLGWYSISYFIGAGCRCDWTTDGTGNFLSYDDTFDSEAGHYALMETYDLTSQEGIYVSSSDGASAFKSGAAICISGIWNSLDVQAALGENFGATDLPSVTIEREDGTTYDYHLGSFSGCKLVGCKPQADAKKAAACQGMANYITDEACQLERYTKHGWGPSNKNAQQNEDIKSDVALNALWIQNQYAVSQGQYPYEYWDLLGGLITSYKASSSHTYETAVSLMADYKKALNSYLNV